MRSEQMQGVVSELEKEDIEPLTDTALAEGMVELRRTMDRLEFQFSRRLWLFSKRRGYITLGFVSLIAWLRRACRLMPGVAMQHSEVARNLPSLPQTSAALASGEIGFHHAAVIARSVTEVGAEAIVEEESRLVRAAHNLDPKYLSYLTRRLRYSIDPDGTLAHSNDQYDYRYLHLSQTLDGVFYLDARLDAEGGATLRTVLNALEPNGMDERSGSMRRADALVEMARKQLDAGTLPEVGGQKPHLSVIASADHCGRGATAGLRQRDDPRASRSELRADRRRPLHSHHPTGPAARAGRPRQRLPFPRLRPAGRLVRRPPSGSLDRRRRDQTCQHVPALPTPPPIRPRAWLAIGVGRRRRDSCDQTGVGAARTLERSLSPAGFLIMLLPFRHGRNLYVTFGKPGRSVRGCTGELHRAG